MTTPEKLPKCQMCVIDGFKPVNATKLAIPAPDTKVIKTLRRKNHHIKDVVLYEDKADINCSCGWTQTFTNPFMDELITARSDHLLGGAKRMCSDCFTKYAQEEINE